jgi:hypothetical protein
MMLGEPLLMKGKIEETKRKWETLKASEQTEILRERERKKS